MSERKTAEIKFRCMPSFKARLAEAAAAAEQSMSEYIESAVWFSLVGNREIADDTPVATVLTSDEIAALLSPPNPGLVVETPPVFSWSTSWSTPAEVLKDTGVDASTCSCRPWEFCPHKANA